MNPKKLTLFQMKLRGKVMFVRPCTLKWYQHGKLHRDGDKPAVNWTYGPPREWYQHGKRHRDDDKPAVIWIDMPSRGWYKHGKLHRDNNKPAVIYACGTQIADFPPCFVTGKLYNEP